MEESHAWCSEITNKQKSKSLSVFFFYGLRGARPSLARSSLASLISWSCRPRWLCGRLRSLWWSRSFSLWRRSRSRSRSCFSRSLRSRWRSLSPSCLSRSLLLFLLFLFLQCQTNIKCCCCWSLLYSAILHSHNTFHSHYTRMWFYMSEQLFTVRFLISTEVVYRQPWHGWCHMKLLLYWHVLCTPYNHAPCHFMQSHISYVRCMCI